MRTLARLASQLWGCAVFLSSGLKGLVSGVRRCVVVQSRRGLDVHRVIPSAQQCGLEPTRSVSFHLQDRVRSILKSFPRDRRRAMRSGSMSDSGGTRIRTSVDNNDVQQCCLTSVSYRRTVSGRRLPVSNSPHQQRHRQFFDRPVLPVSPRDGGDARH